MQCTTLKSIPIQAGQSGSFYVNLPSQSAPLGPTVGDIQEPFDLTNATEIVASFPGGVVEKLSLSQVSVQGAPGAGKIKVNYSALDSSRMQPNPVQAQNQDLQVIAVISGVAQVDTLSIPGSVVPNTVFTITLNGVLFSYTSIAGDTQQSVFTALQAMIAQYGVTPGSPCPCVACPLPVIAVVVGSGTGATLTITSNFAGLGFTAVVSNITLTPTTPNGGTTGVFLFKFALDISPQSYPYN